MIVPDPKLNKGYDMQQAIFGSGAPEVEPHYPAWREDVASPAQLASVTNYLQKASPNPDQEKVIEHHTKSNKPITILHGPPGTGKTLTAARILQVLAGLLQNNLACAPTNTATSQLYNHLVAQRKLFKSVALQSAAKSKLVYLKTLSDYHALLSRKVTTAEKTHEHGFLTYFFQMVNRDAIEKDPILPKEANDFLRVFNQIQKDEGGVVDYGTSSRTEYLGYFDANWYRVLNEFGDQLTIVTTCNNSSMLWHDKLKWKPVNIVIDEAAFGLESDTIIPICIGAERILLAGDHLQLLPIVLSMMQNVAFKQMKLSLFGRLHVCGTPTFRLSVNYRMHPRIAKFPGALVYAWLGSALNTELKSEAFLQLEKMWNSEQYAGLRNRRRPKHVTKLGDKPDCRRLFLNLRTVARLLRQTEPASEISPRQTLL